MARSSGWRRGSRDRLGPALDPSGLNGPSESCTAWLRGCVATGPSPVGESRSMSFPRIANHFRWLTVSEPRAAASPGRPRPVRRMRSHPQLALCCLIGPRHYRDRASRWDPRPVVKQAGGDDRPCRQGPTQYRQINLRRHAREGRGETRHRQCLRSCCQKHGHAKSSPHVSHCRCRISLPSSSHVGLPFHRRPSGRSQRPRRSMLSVGTSNEQHSCLVRQRVKASKAL